MAIKGWKIEVPGVRSAIARTAAAAEPFGGHAKTYAEALYNAGYATGSDRIKQALAGFGEHHQYTLPLAFKRTSNCVEGAAKATNAYLVGDESMAEEAQRNAAKAPRPSDLGKSRK